MRRLRLAVAISALGVVALASSAGPALAAAGSTHAKAPHVRVVSHSAASAQYGKYTPPAKAKPSAGAVGPARTSPRATLPFTGLELWVPVAIGLPLIGLGLALRARGRRGGAVSG